MSLRDQPHVKTTTTQLADWIEQQGADLWWSVDGDPFLTSRLMLPAPGAELAAGLRRFNRTLLVGDFRASPTGRGEEITAKDLDAFVTRFGDGIVFGGTVPPEMNDRLLYCCWEGQDNEWMIIEEQQTTAAERREALAREDT